MKYLSIIVVIALAACSGGGGGGDGDSAGRTRETALRLMHGVFDEAPIDLVVDGLTLQRARYMQATNYVSVDSGSRIIQAVSSRGEILDTIVGNLEDETEYTLLVSGKIEDGSERARLITDRVERPEEGEAFFRVYAAVDSLSAVRAIAPGVSIAASEGTASSFATGISGLNLVSVETSRGRQIASTTLDLVDRSEVGLLVSGSADLGFYEVVAFNDLD